MQKGVTYNPGRTVDSCPDSCPELDSITCIVTCVLIIRTHRSARSIKSLRHQGYLAVPITVRSGDRVYARLLVHYFGSEMGMGVCLELHGICGGKHPSGWVFSMHISHDLDALQLNYKPNNYLVSISSACSMRTQ